MSKRFTQLVTECAQLIGFKTPQITDDFYALLIDDIRVLIEPTETGTPRESLYFCSHIGEVPEHNRKRVTDYILEKNADTQFTGAASVGVLPEKNTIAVFQLLPPMVDRPELMLNELNRFVDISERVKHAVENIIDESPVSSGKALNHMLSV